MEPIPIKSIQELIDWNLKNTTESEKEVRFLFRGVSNSEYKLIPKICRFKEKSGSIKDPTLRIKLLKNYLKIHLPRSA